MVNLKCLKRTNARHLTATQPNSAIYFSQFYRDLLRMSDRCLPMELTNKIHFADIIIVLKIKIYHVFSLNVYTDVLYAVLVFSWHRDVGGGVTRNIILILFVFGNMTKERRAHANRQILCACKLMINSSLRDCYFLYNILESKWAGANLCVKVSIKWVVVRVVCFLAKTFCGKHFYNPIVNVR